MAIGAFGDYRIFSDEQGRTVEAALIKYDPASGRVQLETKKGRQIWMDPGVFSSADQEFIKKWLRLEPFLNPEILKISITAKEGDWKTTGRIGFSSKTRKEKSTKYTIHFENTGTTKLSRIRMEYCIFSLKKTGRSSYIATKFHTKPIGIIKPLEQKEFTSVTCKSIKGTSDGGTEDVIGACFRFYSSIPSEDEVMREMRFPRLLPEKKYPWKAPVEKKKSIF
jgi:hypothetical protein